MQDKSSQSNNSNTPDEKPKPKMVKPVTGEFKKNKSKLKTMIKNARSEQKADK